MDQFIVRARSGWMRGKYLMGFHAGTFRWTKTRNRGLRFDSTKQATDFCSMLGCAVTIVKR